MNKFRYRYMNWMFIGDSITVGNLSVPQVGFRPSVIANLITKFKIPYKVVGSNVTANMGTGRISGASGLRVDEIYTQYTVADAPSFRPDIVFIHAGTNDATQRNTGAWLGTEADSINSMGQILDAIRNVSDRCRVFLAKIIPNQNAGADAIITSYNTALQTMRDARSDLSFITMVDHNTAFKDNASWASDYMGDVTHPNNAGHAVMATTWNSMVNTIYP